MRRDDQGRYSTPEMHPGSSITLRCEGTDFEELIVHVLRTGHALRFRARGSSMHPVVQDGDILQVHPVEQVVMHGGDIILYRSPRKGIVVHRVVNTIRHGGEEVLVVKGDASRIPDPEVLVSQVLGKIVRIERRGRSIAPRSRLWRCVAALDLRFPRLGRLAYVLLRQADGGLGRIAAGGAAPRR